MEKIVSILQNYNEILTEAFVALMSLILIIFLARILRQIKRLNFSLTSITNNIQAYFDVILQDEPQKTEEQTVQQEPVQSKSAVQEKDFEDQERRKQEEEVFNAVLQEYFPG
ncbi:MAG: hypothetical protein HFI69_07120 [Lachnospiraceae bacterium]|nr:hypothetical protein [Lachnospiraceae bacterium]